MILVVHSFVLLLHSFLPKFLLLCINLSTWWLFHLIFDGISVALCKTFLYASLLFWDFSIDFSILMPLFDNCSITLSNFSLSHFLSIFFLILNVSEVEALYFSIPLSLISYICILLLLWYYPFFVKKDLNSPKLLRLLKSLIWKVSTWKLLLFAKWKKNYFLKLYRNQGNEDY